MLPQRNRAAFLSQSFDSDADGGLFVPGDLDVDVGAEIELEIHFLEEDVRFRIRALVRWKRVVGRRAAPPGVGLTFLASEHNARTQLVAFANGSTITHKERDGRRLPGHVEARVDFVGAKPSKPAVVCHTDDVSHGGCFLLLTPPPAIGTQLKVRLKAPGALFSWLGVDAVVCWQREGGDRPGVGVQYRFANDRERRRAERLVALLRERSRNLQVSVRRSTPPTAAGSQPPASAHPSMLPRK